LSQQILVQILGLLSIVPRTQLTNTLLSVCSPSTLPAFVVQVQELKKLEFFIFFKTQVSEERFLVFCKGVIEMDFSSVAHKRLIFQVASCETKPLRDLQNWKEA